MTLSFLGFKVDEDGNAEFLDPQTGEISQKSLMPRRLRTGLYVQNVDLNHDFESKNKYVCNGPDRRFSFIWIPA